MKQYYYHDGQSQIGPIELEKLKEVIFEKDILSNG
jgi:hypothetical protein